MAVEFLIATLALLAGITTLVIVIRTSKQERPRQFDRKLLIGSTIAAFIAGGILLLLEIAGQRRWWTPWHHLRTRMSHCRDAFR